MNSPRRVGPQRVQDFGLRAESRFPQRAKPGHGHLGAHLRPLCCSSGRTIWATIKRWRPSGKTAKLPHGQCIYRRAACSRTGSCALDQGSRLGTFEPVFGPINVRRRGKDHPDARDRNSPVRVSTLMRTPCSRYSGTCTTKPVSKVAGLVRPVAELPRVAGSQCVTASSTATGN